MAELQWGDPPPDGRSRGHDTDFDAVRAALIARSGDWADIKTYAVARSAHAVAHRARSSARGWAGHIWEATTRKAADGSTHLFVRHIRKDS